MKRRIGVGLLCTMIVAGLAAQEGRDLLDTYRRNFELADIEVKVQVLADAVGRPEGLGPLFHEAIDFVVNDATRLSTDDRYRQLARIAVEGVRSLRYGAACVSLWKLFGVETETLARVSILRALGAVAVGQADTVREMVEWLENQNSLHASGQKPDNQVILAGVQAFGQIGDPAAFGAVFATMNQGFSEEITRAASASLRSMEGDPARHLEEIIRSRPPARKLQALRMALGGGWLPGERQAEVAELALETALASSPSGPRDRESIRSLRRESARFLGERKWSRASPLVIECFNQTLLEHDRGIVDKQALIEAVQSLGSMEEHEAAVRLTKYLVLLNSYMERGQGSDEQIVLAVLENLGRLGDKVAFADLVYTQYLGYSSQIRETARQAQNSLKW